jgi:hypothetical protein
MRPMLAAAGISLALGLAPGAGGVTHATPKLRLAGQIVLGSGFHARERVHLRFINNKAHLRTVKTNAKGVFSTPLAPFDSCKSALIVKAVGDAGDSAKIKVPRGNCLPE